MRSVKRFRIWSLLFLGIGLRSFPQHFKGQHRAGEVVIWASSFPRRKK